MLKQKNKNIFIIYGLLIICVIVIMMIYFFGNKVRVGIIDSGLSKDISANSEAGWNYVGNNDDTNDTVGHGTNVAWLIHEQAPRAVLIPLKITEDEELTLPEMMVDAIYDGVDKYGCDILEISSGMSDSEELKAAVAYAEKKGVIIISPVGNQGNTYKKDKIYYPTGYDTVIGIGSVDENGEVSDFSQRNDSVYVTSCGENVEVDVNGEKKEVTGTSYATAIVAGRIAKKSWKSPKECREWLKKQAKDVGEDGYDTSYGWGILE